MEWVETTEEVVITDDGPSSENNLAGIKLLVHLLVWVCGLVNLQTDK